MGMSRKSFANLLLDKKQKMANFAGLVSVWLETLMEKQCSVKVKLMKVWGTFQFRIVKFVLKFDRKPV